jgi:hypothetical protein
VGYYTYITGGGEIVPPLDDKKLEEFKTEASQFGYFDFQQIPGDQTVTLVNGIPTVVGNDPGKTQVDFGYEESGKFYNFPDAVTALTNLCIKEKALFNATFDGDGEESEDFWRITVVDNVVDQAHGEISFPDPDDEKAKLRSKIIETIRSAGPQDGHGNVIPRKDGTRDLTCPGLPTCKTCRTEQEILTELIWRT